MLETAKTFGNAVISAFIALNLLTVAYINAPERWLARLEAAGGHRLRAYAAFVGLDTRWEMFSNAKGEDWRLIIEGECPHGPHQLPLAGQEQRTFWEEHLFDFKEGKLRCNILFDARVRRSYADFLCRRHSCPGGEKLRRLRIDMLHQRILEPAEAAKQGRHLAPVVRRETLEDVGCA